LAMSRTKQDNRADFGDILAGFDRQSANEETAAADRRSPLEPQNNGGATPRRENSVRSLLQNISFPWPSRIPGFVRSFGNHSRDAYAEAAGDATAAPCPDPPESASPEAASPGPSKTKAEDAAIAEELGLNESLGTLDLKRIRRDFAKKNHPDRFEPARRTGAERRMSIANMLIDEMMRRSQSYR